METDQVLSAPWMQRWRCDCGCDWEQPLAIGFQERVPREGTVLCDFSLRSKTLAIAIRRKVEGNGQRGNDPKSSQRFSEILRRSFLIRNGQEKESAEKFRTVLPLSVIPLPLRKR